MQRISYLLAATGALLCVFALAFPAYSIQVRNCIEGNSNAKTEQRTLATFNKLAVDGAFDVRIACGKPQTVTVTTDSNLLPFITTTVNGGTLTIGSRESICTKSALRIDISVPDLTYLKTAGASDIDVRNISNAAFTLMSDGAGDISLAGKTRSLTLRTEGSADISAKALIADAVDISLKGAGDAVIHAVKTLKAALEGAGDITYYGQPATVNRHIDGAGEITSADGNPHDTDTEDE